MRSILRKAIAISVGVVLTTTSALGASSAIDETPVDQPMVSGQGAAAPVAPLPQEPIRVAQAQSNQSVLQSSESRDSKMGRDASKETEPRLQEVVVTAEKREENPIDVAMSLTAISGQQLTAEHITDIMDLSRAVPSLSAFETGPGRQNIAIRGFSSIRGSSSLTGIYLDEMPLSGVQDSFTPAYTDVEVIDLERVEVLKGPQGTLFGEGSAGGVIRFITNDPDLTRAGGEVLAQLYDTADGALSEKITGVGNLPLGPIFGVRVAASYENASGWIDQPSIGRTNINNSDVKHVRLKALLAPTDALSIKALVEIHRNSGGASNIVNLEPRSESNFLQPFDIHAPTGYFDNYDLYNLTINYNFGFAELLSSTSYSKVDSIQSSPQLEFVPGTSELWFQASIPEYSHEGTAFSQELRLTSAPKGPFNWTIGVNYRDDKLDYGFLTGLDAILFGGALVLPGLSEGITTIKSDSWAGFGDASYLFFDRLELGGGLRYYTDRREVTPPTQSDHFHKTTFRTYARYVISKGVNVYVNVASGFRSGGFNDPTEVPLGAPSAYGTEESLSYELGTKMALPDAHLSLTAALFYGKYNNMQEATTIESPVNQQPIQFTTNQQDAVIKGFELELNWAATDRLTFNLAGDVTHSEITHITPGDLNSPYFVGDPVNFVPKYTLVAGADYRFHWAAAVPGFVMVNFNRKGEATYTSRGNSLILVDQEVSPAVNFLSASLGAELNNWRWSVFGRNLTDERGALNPALTGWTAQARPRTIGVEVSKSF